MSYNITADSIGLLLNTSDSAIASLPTEISGFEKLFFQPVQHRESVILPAQFKRFNDGACCYGQATHFTLPHELILITLKFKLGLCQLYISISCVRDNVVITTTYSIPK